MSKRFFSLLLVVCMLFALAAPALAASDGIATISRGDFSYEKTGLSGADALRLSVFTTLKGARDSQNADGVYNSDAYAAFVKAYDAAKKIIDEYEINGTKPTQKDVNDATKALTINKGEFYKADDADIEKLQAKVDEFNEVVKTLSSAGQKEYNTNIPQAIKDAQDAINAIKNGATSGYPSRTSVNEGGYMKYVNGKDGLIDVIDTLIKTAKETYAPEQTVSIKQAYVINSSGPQLSVELTSFNVSKDNNIYSLKVSVNGKSAYLIPADPTNKDVKTVSDVALDAKLFKLEGPDAEDFTIKKNAEITVTLYTNVEKDGWFGGVSDDADRWTETEVASKVLTYDPDQSSKPSTVSGLKAVGFATDNQDKSKPTDVTISDKDKIYIQLDTESVEVGKYTGGLFVSISANGKTYDHADKLSKAVTEISLDDVSKKVASKPDAPYLGTYTVTLKGVNGATIDTIGTKTFELKAIDATELKALVNEIKAVGSAALSTEYGNYDTVAALSTALTAANNFLKNDPAAAVSKNLEDFGDKDDGLYKDLKDAWGNVYSIKELKALVDQAMALNPKDYTNWTTGTMESALLNARQGLVRAVKSATELNSYTEDWDGNGTKEALAKKTVLTKSEYNDLLAELKLAIDTLEGGPAKDSGLKVGDDGKLYLYKDGEIQKTGYTEAPAGSGIYYYFSVKDGHAFKGGVVTGEGGKKYVADSTGVLQSGLVTVGSDAYYCSVKDHHIYRNGIVSAGGTRQYIAGKDGKLLKDKQTVGSNSYYCSVKDYHIWKAVKNTAWVTGTVAKYQINAKGVILATKPLKG